MAEVSEVFFQGPSHRILTENALAFASRDNFPVRPLYTLIDPIQHVSDIRPHGRKQRVSEYRKFFQRGFRGDF
jgi:diadenosine tetraphosphate (Ap4A) HIT family hydrolase